MTFVFRVEHRETGLGPYVTDAPNGLHGKEADASDRCPVHDNLPPGIGNQKYGFEHPDHLTRWFTTEQRRYLASGGFVLAVYGVEPQYVISDSRKTQVVFSTTQATKFSNLNLTPTEEV